MAFSPIWFDALVRWQRVHGRQGMPWQGTREPYRVWLSEVMLQQTQVATVRPYYARFLEAFATVQALAQAPESQVMALWSGLGYYSRARHLHACAQQVVAQHGGAFPRDALSLQALPGIGPSTAAAIAAFCFGQRVSILDGNVKRVLSRVWGYEQDITSTAGHQALWTLAQSLLPAQPAVADMADYTQGLMDLGATVCKPRQPLCTICPAQGQCVAHTTGRQHDLPVKLKRVRRTTEDGWWRVWVRPDGAVRLQRRPHKGVWAGLYAFDDVPDEATALAPPAGALAGAQPIVHPTIRHVLTHKDWLLHLVQWPVQSEAVPQEACLDADGVVWLGPHDNDQLVGLPAPLRRWLHETLWATAARAGAASAGHVN